MSNTQQDGGIWSQSVFRFSVRYEEDYMNSSRFLPILVLMFMPLSLFAAEQRSTVPITPAPPVTRTPVVQGSATTLAPPPVEAVVPQAPVPADVSRQPAGAPAPGLQPMPGAARSGSSLPAAVSCGTWGEKLKVAVDRDMPVPALQPGEGYSVMKRVSGVMAGTPVKVSWTGEIDPGKQVTESNEQNNRDGLNRGQYFW
jgi:hypothetical protein